MATKQEINQYLYAEFAFDLECGGDESRISDGWPFQLRYLGQIPDPSDPSEVYQFDYNGETYHVVSGWARNYHRAAGVTLDDLALAYQGSSWISERGPIDLNTFRIGDPSVPPAYERRAAILSLATLSMGRQEGFTIAVGLYLKATGQYLALVEDELAGSAYVVASGFGPHKARLPHSPGWRRLAIGVGELLRAGILRDGPPTAQ